MKLQTLKEIIYLIILTVGIYQFFTSWNEGMLKNLLYSLVPIGIVAVITIEHFMGVE